MSVHERPGCPDDGWRATAVPDGSTAVLDEVGTDERVEEPSTVIVWDDPVNLMSYVVLVFSKVFPAWDRATCERKMLEVHLQGKSAVFAGDRGEAERIAAVLQSYQLWVTVQR